jgi:hypothetical protein
MACASFKAILICHGRPALAFGPRGGRALIVLFALSLPPSEIKNPEPMEKVRGCRFSSATESLSSNHEGRLFDA